MKTQGKAVKGFTAAGQRSEPDGELDQRPAAHLI